MKKKLYLHVAISHILATEGNSANYTSEWLFTSVTQHVYPQMVGSKERLKIFDEYSRLLLINNIHI